RIKTGENSTFLHQIHHTVVDQRRWNTWERLADVPCDIRLSQITGATSTSKMYCRYTVTAYEGITNEVPLDAIDISVAVAIKPSKISLTVFYFVAVKPFVIVLV